MPTALIKFDQPSGGGTGGDGKALIGVAGLPVTIRNVDDSGGAALWTWTLIDCPPESALLPGVKQIGAIPYIDFSPDVAGGYLWLLVVQDENGITATDERVFQILEPSGRLISPKKASDASLNFVVDSVENTRGWAPYMEAYLRAIDTGDPLDLDTTGATPTRVKRYPVADGEVLSIRAVVSVRSTDGSAAVLGEWEVKGAYVVSGGTLAQAYAPTVTNNFLVGLPGDPTLTLNGNTDVDLNVTGIAATNLSWRVSEFSL